MKEQPISDTVALESPSDLRVQFTFKLEGEAIETISISNSFLLTKALEENHCSDARSAFPELFKLLVEKPCNTAVRALLMGKMQAQMDARRKQAEAKPDFQSGAAFPVIPHRHPDGPDLPTMEELEKVA